MIYTSPKSGGKIPLFSVFFKDYITHKYSLTALASVVNQTVDIEDYEIIVLTDRGDVSDYEQMMDMNNYKIITTNLINLGESYNIFLEYAKGIYACPIDNDDSWEINRLELIKDIIHNNSDIGFIKNEVNVISEQKNDFYIKIKYYIKMNIPLRTSNKIYYIGDLTKKKILGRSLAHNVSSMAIKMSILKERRNIIKFIYTHDDPYLFFFAFCSNKKVIFIDMPLSNYLIRKNSLTTRDKNQSAIVKLEKEYKRFAQIPINQTNLKDANFVYNFFLLYKLTLELLINIQGSKTVNLKNSELKKGLKLAFKFRMHNFILLFLAMKIKNKH